MDRVTGDALRLRAAVIDGDLATAEEVLLSHPGLVDAADEPDPAGRPSDARGVRPLHLAVANDEPEMVRLLLACGADPYLRNADGRTPLRNRAGVDPREAARAQVGQDVETYFPRRALGRKQLERTIELLGTAADT